MKFDGLNLLKTTSSVQYLQGEGKLDTAEGSWLKCERIEERKEEKKNGRME